MTEVGTIDSVIDRLTAIVAEARDDRSRLGYFPALYRKVTIEIKERIDQGDFFDDNERLERLDVVFAGRYLDAFEHYRAGAEPTRSWDLAFRVARQRGPIVLQHLLLGINAHINVDLGVASARVAPGVELPALRADFDRINGILSSLMVEVREELTQIWPTLRFFNNYLGREEELIINFSLEKAREHAWSVAEDLAPLSLPEQEEYIVGLDRRVLKLALLIRHPGILLSTVLRIVRLGERGGVVRIIDILG